MKTQTTSTRTPPAAEALIISTRSKRSVTKKVLEKRRGKVMDYADNSIRQLAGVIVHNVHLISFFT